MHCEDGQFREWKRWLQLNIVFCFGNLISTEVGVIYILICQCGNWKIYANFITNLLNNVAAMFAYKPFCSFVIQVA